jgi:hypothetical protein
MLSIDSSEPEDIEKLLSQAVEVCRMPLNQQGMSDYYFVGADNKSRQFSRKQAGELLGNIDEAERQIRNYYDSADENFQIVEGVISPVPLLKRAKSFEVVSTRIGKNPRVMFTYKVAPSGYLFGERQWDCSNALLYSWLFQLAQAGVQTFFTINSIETAQLLASIYRNCQKTEHTTLHRYIRPRVTITPFNPLALSLMSISYAYRVGIGEEKALALTDRFESLLSIAMASPSELTQVPGIGNKLAKSLLGAIGRNLSEE